MHKTFSKLNRFGGDGGYIVGPTLKQFHSEPVTHVTPSCDR